ncbi:ATP-binding protein, partial [Neglectibacter timonensis]
ADTKEITHSGTGRFTWLTMRPMSLYESGDSTGDISLKVLFENTEEVDGTANLSLDRLAFLICRGGWPQAIDMRDEIALDQARDYYDAVVHSDINRADHVQKNPERVKRLMRSYARNQGGQVPNTVIAQDIAANDESPISEETVASYLDALRKIFVVEDMPAWNPNLRSKTAIRSSDTRYYIDPSIAAAALGVGPTDLLNDLKTFGFLFETLCVRDLRVFADALNGEVYHYRDKDGQECDAVIHLRNGKYGLIEMKLGGDKLIEEGAKSLKAMQKKIDTEKMKSPSFLMVLTGIGDYAYRRHDGVCVVPIGCLKN